MSDVIEAKLPDAESTIAPSVQEAAEVAPPARPEYEELIYRGQFEMKEISPFFNLLSRVKRVPILLYLTSDGGAPGYAMQLIEKLKSFDVPVTIVSELHNGSAAAIFPHHHDFVRLAYPHSLFTYHWGLTRISGTSPEELENQRNYISVIDNDFTEAAREKIGLSKKEFKKYNGVDIIIYGIDCLNIGENGMVDGLILEDYRDGRFLCKTRTGNKIIDVTIHRRDDIPNLPVVEEKA